MSSTWQEKSVYSVQNMHIIKNYGFDMALDFGFETVTFGYPRNGIQPVQHVLVGQMAEWKFSTVGYLGLDPKPTNFTDTTAMSGPQTSLMQYLKDNRTIPSLSFGYTAGAQYRKLNFQDFDQY